MNAIQFLISEHEKVRKELMKIADNKITYAKKRELFDTLSRDIMIHETVEEDKWYPHFKNDLSTTVKHLINEEKYAAKEIKSLNSITNEDLWNDKFLNFKESVEKHAKEEEEMLFPVVIKILNSNQLDKIGDDLKAYKNELLKESIV